MKQEKPVYGHAYFNSLFFRQVNNSQRNRTRLALILREKLGGRLLEIGCGTAKFLRLASDHYDVEGIDISRYAIESVRAEFDQRVRVANIEHSPLKTNHYDVIVAFNVFEHLHKPKNVLNRVFSALTTDGLLIGSVPNNYGLVGGFVTRLTNFFDRTHVSTHDPATWKRLFQQAGFSSVFFFGELQLGPNHCRYLTSPSWPHLSFNLMFLCRK